MPGPVSDSYDPEFSTSANAEEVRLAIQSIVHRVTGELGATLADIVQVVHGEPGPAYTWRLTEQELRIIRFGLNRALESL
jgi:hypothetical protein